MDLNSVKHRLEATICPTHLEYPIITLKDKGFSISCCCDTFKDELVRLSKEYIADSIKDDISKIFKK